jgi:CHAT domain-containing protein
MKENTVLSDKYNLIQLASTAYVIDKVETIINSEDKILLYGGVNYDAKLDALHKAAQQNLVNKTRSRSITDDLTSILSAWSDLPETTEEVNKITEIGKRLNFHIDPPVTGVFATEESIKELSGKMSPAVLHIATHGFFFPKSTNENIDSLPFLSEKASVFRQSEDPMLRSGLILAGANNLWKGKRLEGVEDGILTSYEVSNLYLPNTKLAVLSACETALGDIRGSEGVYGLQRAFKIAGVQNLVMSLWKVPSKETAEFMEIFYQKIFENKSITKAFYEAQNSMKEKYRNNPYNWAAWILVK